MSQIKFVKDMVLLSRDKNRKPKKNSKGLAECQITYVFLSECSLRTKKTLIHKKNDSLMYQNLSLSASIN